MKSESTKHGSTKRNASFKCQMNQHRFVKNKIMTILYNGILIVVSDMIIRQNGIAFIPNPTTAADMLP